MSQKEQQQPTETEAMTIEEQTASEHLAQRATKEWSALCREGVEVVNLYGVLYAYGTELAALRLHYEFRKSGDRAKVGYSESRQTWYFRLEPAF